MNFGPAGQCPHRESIKAQLCRIQLFCEDLAPEAVYALKGTEGDAAVLLEVVVHHARAAPAQQIQGAPASVLFIHAHGYLRSVQLAALHRSAALLDENGLAKIFIETALAHLHNIFLLSQPDCQQQQSKCLCSSLHGSVRISCLGETGLRQGCCQQADGRCSQAGQLSC